VPFLWIRTLGGLALIWWLSSRIVRVSLRRDAQLLLPHVPTELRPEYEKLAANWKGDEQEIASERHEMAHLSPQIVLAFVSVFSVMAWDFTPRRCGPSTGSRPTSRPTTSGTSAR
jgi:hypothetical protein